jgi:hypothetical protein
LGFFGFTNNTSVARRHRVPQLQYTAVFEPAPEGGFTVTVPALPGLVTEGDTIEKRAIW